jgi:hypothetical protein
MVETRIKPYDQQMREEAAREEQRRTFRRNQVFGLLIAAAGVVVWTLLHTKREWILPAGWWRF